MRYTSYESPLGEVLLAGHDTGLTLLNFQAGSHPAKVPSSWRRSERPFAAACAQLDRYFDGSLRAFDLPLAPKGTAFQQEVWNALLRIPFGTTLSYGDLARRIRRPRAVRAVGAANGANPIPLIIPCHRVIGASGRLTGYGGGLEIKERLLAHEGARLRF